MKDSRWRKYYRPIIARVLADTHGQTVSEQNAALRAAFPNGARELHPYRMWLKEIRAQRGLLRDKPRKVLSPGQLDFLPMTNEEAFEAAIERNKNDSATRFIYADWLEEHGETDRAERQRAIAGRLQGASK